MSAAVIGASVLIAVGLNPEAAQIPRENEPGQLLQDGSFELRGASTPWTAHGTGKGRTGTRSATVTPGHPAGQNVPVAGVDGHSYRFDAWIKGRGAGQIVVATRCPHPESQATSVRANDAWQHVSATLEARHASACSLGVRVEGTSGAFSVDDGALTDQQLHNGSFEAGLIGWTPTAATIEGPSVEIESVVDQLAPDGTHVARIRSLRANGSVKTVVPLDRATEPFEATLSLVMRRAPSVAGAAPSTGAVPVTVALWGRCPGHDAHANVQVDAGPKWTEVRVRFRFSAVVERTLIRPSGEPCELQPEIYLKRAGTSVDLDAVSVSRRTVAIRRR